MSLLKSMHLNGHQKVSLEECYLFTRQLHVLQKSGVPLLSSLHALQTQLPAGTLKTTLHAVRRDLQEGRTFSQALGRHPQVFTAVFLGLVRVGEAGGLLDEVLQQLARLFEWEMELRNRIRDALQYPIIVLSTLSIALLIMTVFVLPRFGQMFSSFRIQLPLQTRLLVALSTFLSHYGWLLAFLACAVGAAWGWYVRTEAGRLRWHTWQLRLPVVGPVLLQLAMSRFARVTAALHHNGVPILETLTLAAQNAPNRYVRGAIERVRDRIRGGGSLAGAMKTESVFPAAVIQMVATGEETGRLDELLQSISEYFDQQAAYTVKRLITYIEPALLIVVGLGVLMMATAVLLPMWDLVKLFKQTGG